ncbi:MAG: P-II family nitrogen regulator [Pirellulales bacterium]
MPQATANSSAKPSPKRPPPPRQLIPPRLIRKIAIEIAVNEDFIDKTVETITHAARTGTEGRIGDGKIFLLPLEEVIRLSDTVRGPEGVS